MTEQHERSLMEQLEADPRARVEIALADFVLRTEQLFEAALEQRPDLHLSTLAECVGVDEDRVRRLAGGEDSLRPEAFVRYLRALGYGVVVNAYPVDSDVPELPGNLHRWNADIVDTYSQRAANVDGVWNVTWHRIRSGAAETVPLERAHHVETREGRTGAVVPPTQAAYEAVLEFDDTYTPVLQGG